MAGVTEIYICGPGQALNDGKLEYSSTVTDRPEAEADAARRMAGDHTIAKIAYYEVDEAGNFRNFYTYTNPHGGKPPPPSAGELARKKKRAKQKAAAERSLWKRLMGIFR